MHGQRELKERLRLAQLADWQHPSILCKRTTRHANVQTRQRAHGGVSLCLLR
jgi:hypothetical protein